MHQLHVSIFSTGYARLKYPSPSDIRSGLSAVADPDPLVTSDLEPFESVGIGEDNIPHVYVGVEAGLVVEKDFIDWKKTLMGWLSVVYKTFGNKFPNFDCDLLNWAVGMLWPDQSYVSLRKFRGRQSSGGWGEYHESRFRMLLGV